PTCSARCGWPWCSTGTPSAACSRASTCSTTSRAGPNPDHRGGTGMTYRWTPIEPPANPHALAVQELRAFEVLWRQERASLVDHAAVDAFTERMARRWAIETGIIERLYDVSEGITLQLVQHGFHASLVPHGESTIPADELVAILRDH